MQRERKEYKLADKGHEILETQDYQSERKKMGYYIKTDDHVVKKNP